MTHENTVDSIFSGRLSECMDMLGYSFNLIKYRQKMNKHMDALYNSSKDWSKNTVITTGGKGEGTAKYFESDIDRLFALEGVVCVNKTESVNIDGHCQKRIYGDTAEIDPSTGGTIKRDITVFELDTDGCSPGYARLRLKQRGSGYHFAAIEECLIQETDGVYLDNSFPKFDKDKYQMFDVNVRNIDADQKSGPSMSYSNSDISYDFVNGFVFTDKHTLHEWAQRRRPGDWPPPNLKKDVCDTWGQLVPVSDKNGQYPHTEWRICFTEAELVLVRSMNECQIKVLILLKLISKSMLKSICKDISSYVIKNVVMWMAERYPATCFTPQTLYQRCFDALSCLRDCILKGQLQNYMIADRNLFAGRISPAQKWNLVAKIDDLLAQRTNMFEHIGNVGRTMQLMSGNSIELKELSQQRVAVEMLLLQKNVEFKKIECEWFRLNYTVEFEDLVERHERYNTLDEQMQSLLVPDKIGFESCTLADVFNERLRRVLS